MLVLTIGNTVVNINSDRKFYGHSRKFYGFWGFFDLKTGQTFGKTIQ